MSLLRDEGDEVDGSDDEIDELDEIEEIDELDDETSYDSEWLDFQCARTACCSSFCATVTDGPLRRRS